MEYAAGLVIGLGVSLAGVATGFDRDRSFYPTVLIVIALYYVLFAVMGASPQILVVESLVAALFFATAVIAFKSKLWIAAVALLVHGVFDYVHPLLIQNPGVPSWWPGFCLAVDLVLGAWLAASIIKRSES